MRWPLADIARAVGGRLIGDQPEWVTVQGVSTDTRAIAGDQLFVALAGERFDAHDFLADALAGGAAALLVSRESAVPAGVPAVVVDDTRLALGRLAAAWRRSFDIPVIAVTGSNGKTTTKEMIASILRAAYGDDAVLATRGNLNNDIGLPLTLLGLDARHRAAVVEMGMNHPGEIAYLTRIGAPTAALVNNAQRAHLEGMGGLDAVAREKGSIYQGVPATGAIVVNADDLYGEGWAALAQGRACWRFALDHEAEVRGEVTEDGAKQHIRLCTPVGETSLLLHAVGRHNARNAVAAATACLAIGIELETVARGLGQFAGVKGRLQVRLGLGGAQVLDDTYNANPDSVRAGIDVLAGLSGRKLLVLGDMGEVGSDGPAYHREIGAYAKAKGVSGLYAMGEASALSVQAFGDDATHFASVDALVAAIRPEMNEQTTVLVKGSRFMKMERVTDAITLPTEEEKH
ncbi:MAG TPA: UDP-N-acetylmuramoyl-tripeptide--D-alanyl-D-alanine ligase [Rhodocyclaceae bacterium]|nr:UDP-N-acetylmuramoyl-tripeptide--D-alanyl-D-alanine ligase [Rhodocyclaceae bacterium]